MKHSLKHIFFVALTSPSPILSIVLLLALALPAFATAAPAPATSAASKIPTKEAPSVPPAATTSTFFTAIIHDLKERDKQLFQYVSTFELEGTKRVMTNTFTELARGDKAASTAAIEKTVMQTADGQWRLLSYLQEQKQLGTVGILEVDGSEARFAFTKDGKTKTATERVGDDLVVGPSLLGFLKRHWDKILKGEKIKARFAVMDRQETVGFEYFKVAEKMVAGRPAIVVKMKASSLIISALVDPLLFTFSKDDATLLELEGRTIVKVKVGDKFKDFDGYTTYSYPAVTK